MSATIIIPTTGLPELKIAVESVLNQTYLTECYVVVDGNEHLDRTIKLLGSLLNNKQLHVCCLPFNTGSNGFYGQRIYAAFTHLINTKYLGYLDQDNWLSKSHVDMCIDTIKKNDLEWCYSLRQIHNKEGNFLCLDDCESLGIWKTYHGLNHVDTNCFFIKTEIANKVSSAWHYGWGGDRVFLEAIAKNFPKFYCTGEYTTHYRLGGNVRSVTEEFFQNGNLIMNKKYNGEYPWRQKI